MRSLFQPSTSNLQTLRDFSGSGYAAGDRACPNSPEWDHQRGRKFRSPKKNSATAPCAVRAPHPSGILPPPASRASGDFGELYLDALNAPGCSKVLFEFLQQPVPHELCRGS
jgi:hypothetical protein